MSQIVVVESTLIIVKMINSWHDSFRKPFEMGTISKEVFIIQTETILFFLENIILPSYYDSLINEYEYFKDNSNAFDEIQIHIDIMKKYLKSLH